MKSKALGFRTTLRLWGFCLLPLVLGFVWGSPRGVDFPLFLGLLAVIGALSLFFWQFYRLYAWFIPYASQSNGQIRRIGLGLLLVQVNLFVAGIWDEVWHLKYGIPFGEDFLWRPHLLLYAGFGLVLFLGLEAWYTLFWRMKGSLAQRLQSEAILGIFLFLLLYLALSLPLDPFWHGLYGADISVWSIPHALMFYLGLGLNFLCFAALEASLSPSEKRLPEFLLLLIFSFMAYFQMLDFQPWERVSNHPAWLLPIFGVLLASGLWNLGKLILGHGFWALLAASLALLLRLGLMQVFQAASPSAFWQGLVLLLPLLLFSLSEIFLKNFLARAIWRFILPTLIAGLLLPFYIQVFALNWTIYDWFGLILLLPLSAWLKQVLEELLSFLQTIASSTEKQAASSSSFKLSGCLAILLAANGIFLSFLDSDSCTTSLKECQMAEKTLKRSQVFGSFFLPLLRLPQIGNAMRFWLWLLRPASTLDFADLQYARLTLGLLLVCFLTSLLSLSYQLYLNQGGQLYAGIASLAICLIYLLARTRHYRWAAWIFSFLPYAIPTLSFLAAPPHDITVILYTCIGFFVASLILKPADFAPYCLLILLWYSLVFYFYFEALQVLEQLQVLIFGLVMLSLVLVTSFMRYSQIQQIDEQLRLLEEVASLAQKSLVDAEAARREAEKANLIKSAFLASISHELRTPLNAIINFSELLRVGRFGDLKSEQVLFLERVVSNGKHLLGLINDVLDISKIAAGSLSLYLEAETDLQDLFADLESTVQALLLDKPVQFCMDNRPVPLFMADRQRIYQIVLNLLSNACKFTESGQIDLRLNYWVATQQICIEVEDTGLGIAAEEQEKVFRAFEQAASGLRLGSGTGLGMPISRALAEAHGGALFFESRLGQGTKFTCLLPLRPPEAVVQRYFLAAKTE